LTVTVSLPSFAQGKGKVLSVNTTVGDRVLLEIENFYFSQRQMEVYYFTKHLALMDQGDRVAINEKNWSLLLNNYIEDMLIYQETQKIGSFFPSEKMVSSVKLKLFDLSKNDSKVRDEMRKLELSMKEISAVSAIALQVASFRQNKFKNKSNNWVDELKKKYVVRLFKGSQKFVPLKY
jgi:hypothetical protein